jgi:hypothetical protein
MEPGVDIFLNHRSMGSEPLVRTTEILVVLVLVLTGSFYPFTGDDLPILSRFQPLNSHISALTARSYRNVTLV